MLKRIVILTLSTLLALGLVSALTACNNNTDEANPIQTFINENTDELNNVSAEHLATLGEGATVAFEAAEGEFIYKYTFPPGPTAEQLKEYADNFLDYGDNVEMYEGHATDLAELIGIEALTVTVRYFDGAGTLISERSYQSNPIAAAE